MFKNLINSPRQKAMSMIRCPFQASLLSASLWSFRFPHVLPPSSITDLSHSAFFYFIIQTRSNTHFLLTPLTHLLNHHLPISNFFHLRTPNTTSHGYFSSIGANQCSCLVRWSADRHGWYFNAASNVTNQSLDHKILWIGVDWKKRNWPSCVNWICTMFVKRLLVSKWIKLWKRNFDESVEMNRGSIWACVASTAVSRGRTAEFSINFTITWIISHSMTASSIEFGRFKSFFGKNLRLYEPCGFMLNGIHG